MCLWYCEIRITHILTTTPTHFLFKPELLYYSLYAHANPSVQMQLLTVRLFTSGVQRNMCLLNSFRMQCVLLISGFFMALEAHLQLSQAGDSPRSGWAVPLKRCLYNSYAIPAVVKFQLAQEAPIESSMRGKEHCFPPDYASVKDCHK